MILDFDYIDMFLTVGSQRLSIRAISILISSQ